MPHYSLQPRYFPSQLSVRLKQEEEEEQARKAAAAATAAAEQELKDAQTAASEEGDKTEMGTTDSSPQPPGESTEGGLDHLAVPSQGEEEYHDDDDDEEEDYKQEGVLDEEVSEMHHDENDVVGEQRPVGEDGISAAEESNDLPNVGGNEEVTDEGE